MNINIIEEIKMKILQGINPRVIILFGSMARGTGNEHSDINLLVVWDEESELSNVKRRLILRKLIGIIEKPIDIITCNTNELKEALEDKNSFTSQIFKEGEVLYGRLDKLFEVAWKS